MKIIKSILPALSIVVFQMQIWAQSPLKGYDAELEAYLIVTATNYKNLDTDTVADFSAAKGASVKLRSSTGMVTEKSTQLFDDNKNKNYYTADFRVELDSTYTVEVTLNSKTYVIDNYCLQKSWKWHFLYHSTNGTKSPASVFRKLEDPENGILICLYGVFPYINYKALGGNQL